MTSRYLARPLRTLEQYKRDRHATRWQALCADMAQDKITMEELRSHMKNCIDTAHYDERISRQWVIKAMFKCLRNNLVIAKGNWWQAYDYMEDDATIERDKQEEACWQDSCAERAHQRLYMRGY